MIRRGVQAYVFVLAGAVAFPCSAGGLAPLTAQPGDPENGLKLIRNMSRASCLICHSIPGLDEKDQGQIGPPLGGIADTIGEADLRLRVVDARKINPETMMPPYFSLENLAEVAPAFEGQTIYSAQEVEDVVAYLMSLNSGAAE